MIEQTTIWTYIKNYKFNSILIKNFLLIFFLVMVPLLCVHFIVFQYNQSTMREEITAANISELTRIRDTVDIIMTEAENISIRLASNPDIELLLSANNISYPLDYQTVSRLRGIQDILKTTTLTNPYVDHIQVYSENNHYLLNVYSGGALSMYEHEWWHKEYLRQKEAFVFWISSLKSSLKETHKLVFFRQLPLQGYRHQGVLMLEIGVEQLAPLLKEITPDQEIYIVNEDGNIVYNQDQTQINQHLNLIKPEITFPLSVESYSDIRNYQGRGHVVSSIPSSRGEWTYLSVVPLERYDKRQDQLQSFIYFLIGIGILFSSIIAFVISIRVYQPIRSLLALLEDHHPVVEDKNRRVGSINEIKFITGTIIRSRELNRELEEELERRYLMMKKAQSVALQAQINPHMIYNTLEAINWKVMGLTNGKNEASIMIHTLSRLMRMSLSAGDNIVALRTEMEHARLYVEMQQLHYKEVLEVVWKIGGNILDYSTVRLTLQPIIENAIHHGIIPSGRPGMITIIAYEEIQNIRIKIKDTGVGISSSTADKINQSFKSAEIKENEHIGLSNVNQRIKLIFGDEYGLMLYSKEGEGTIVEMKLPKLTISKQ